MHSANMMRDVIRWPVARATLATCIVFGLPDRVSDGTPATSDNYQGWLSLDALGIEDWERQVLQATVPVDRPLAAWLSTSTWQDSALARLSHGRGTYGVASFFWKLAHRGWILATVPAGLSPARERILAWAGYNSERAPEFVITLHTDIGPREKQDLIDWCQKRDAWRDPGRLVPRYAAQVIGSYNGWMHVAVERPSADALMKQLEQLARIWGVPLAVGPKEWAWMD